jgi:protein-S-isoprenylcysteine O-methyltransferase Ste14
VQLAGVWFTAQSAGAIDPLELAGIRQAARAESAKGLQFGGPYRVVRHPIYLGWIMIVFGATRMTGDRLTFALLTTTYLLLAIPWEEQALEQSFGSEYLKYKQHVRWRVLPYIY